MHRTLRITVPALLAGVLAFGCSSDRPNPLAARGAVGPAGDLLAAKELPAFPSDPEDFASGLSNPYLAFTPGKVFTYESATPEGLERIVVEVTRKTKTILGVATTVVHDQVYLDGDLIEDTFDWYAQDARGNVWYFGEDSKEIENGVVVSTEGSWEAGVDGALPGIVMLSEPKVGLQYRQELAPGVAEDMAKIMSVSETASVPYGSFASLLETMEWSPLNRGPREHKYYAPGVGLVLEAQPGGGRVELVAITGN